MFRDTLLGTFALAFVVFGSAAPDVAAAQSARPADNGTLYTFKAVSATDGCGLTSGQSFTITMQAADTGKRVRLAPADVLYYGGPLGSITFDGTFLRTINSTFEILRNPGGTLGYRLNTDDVGFNGSLNLAFLSPNTSAVKSFKIPQKIRPGVFEVATWTMTLQQTVCQGSITG